MNRSVFVAAAIILIFSLPATPAYGGVTKISECGFVIDTPGDYELTRDLLFCPDVPLGSLVGSITIASSGVDLNLRGHTITCGYKDDEFPGPDARIGAAVLVQPFLTDVRIRNGSVGNCNTGILMIESSNSEISNVTVTDNRTEFAPNWFGEGIVMAGGINNKITGNQVLRNENLGIVVNFNADSVIRDNTIAENGGNGVVVGGGTGGVFRDNAISHNGGNGIEAFFQANTQYSCNTANNNARAGIALTGIQGGNVIRGNVDYFFKTIFKNIGVNFRLNFLPIIIYSY